MNVLRRLVNFLPRTAPSSVDPSEAAPASPSRTFPFASIPRLAGDYYYASELALTDSDGTFSLTVYRINRLEPPADPDIARVEIKTYASPDPRPGDPATGRVLVQMYFAETWKRGARHIRGPDFLMAVSAA